MDELVSYIDISSSKDIFLIILNQYITTRNIRSNFLKYLEDIIKGNEIEFYYLMINFLKNYQNVDEAVDNIYDFLKGNSTLLNKIGKMFNNITIVKELSEFINLGDNMLNDLKDSLLNEDTIEFFYEIFFDKKIINSLILLIMHLGTNELVEDLVNLAKIIGNLGNQYSSKMLNIVLDAVKRITDRESFTLFLNNNFIGKLRNFLIKSQFFQLEISENCHQLINNIYFDDINGEVSILKIRSFYLSKLLVVTSKDKNDFLFYENCLLNKELEGIKYLHFSVQPVFILGIIDDVGSKNKLRSSILNEKYNYLVGLCFPYGIINKERSVMCSKEDYHEIINLFLKMSFNMETANINSLNITSMDEFEAKEYFYCIISIIIVTVPIIIVIFLFIYQKIKSKKPKKSTIENELKRENNVDYISNKESKVSEEIEKNKKIFITPKWYQNIIKYFDVVKNSKELFNFSLNKTDDNNFNGITYIKGIQGIALILFIFGQTFLVLCNLPSKIFQPYQFYRILKIFFIQLYL